jgi:hypothetical protein
MSGASKESRPGPALVGAGGGGVIVFIAGRLDAYPAAQDLLLYATPFLSVYGAVLLRSLSDALTKSLEASRQEAVLKVARKACEDAVSDPLLSDEAKERIKKQYAALAEASVSFRLEEAGEALPQRRNG